MASGHTEKYQLNQWSLDDPVQMEEFNADNRRVEQALTELENNQLRIAMGSYTGTGEYGENHPITLTFPFKPLLLYTYGGTLSDVFVLTSCALSRYADPDLSNSEYTLNFVWTDNSVSWYNNVKAYAHLNEKDMVYHYMVIGI